MKTPRPEGRGLPVRPQARFDKEDDPMQTKPTDCTCPGTATHSRVKVLANMDLPMLIIFAFFFCLHLGFVLYLRSLDLPIPKLDLPYVGGNGPVLDDDNDDWLTIPRPFPKPVPNAPQPAPKAKKKQHAPAGPLTGVDQPRGGGRRKVSLSEQVQRLGLLQILGSKGSGGALRDLLRSGRADEQQAFDRVGGVTVSSREAAVGALRPKRRGAAGPVGIGDLTARVAGPGAVGTGGSVQERVPVVRVITSEPEVHEGHIPADVVGRAIRSRMVGVKSCYERALKQNPELAGKILVRLALDAEGAVTRASVEHDSLGTPWVAACVLARARRWRFPVNESGGAEVAVPFRFMASSR